MAPAGSDEARNRSMRTCDWRHSAKNRTVQMSAVWSRVPAASFAAGPPPGRCRSCRSSEGAWTSTMSAPPTATPVAAARTPKGAASRNRAAMMAVL
ncbi:hypothetical protein SALBM135S_09602 [Streptomyces alboniger]